MTYSRQRPFMKSHRGSRTARRRTGTGTGKKASLCLATSDRRYVTASLSLLARQMRIMLRLLPGIGWRSLRHGLGSLRARFQQSLTTYPEVAIFCRGFLIVALVALNVRNVAALEYRSAFLTGCAISLVWWGNARVSAHSDVPAGRWIYALGAGCGTLFGMWLGR